MPLFEKFATLTALEGYRPGQSKAGPDANPNTIYRGSGYWIRAGGLLKPCRGALQMSAVALGPRIWPLDIYRGEILGSLVGGRLPKEALVRYQASALFFLSENVNQQVMINESISTPFDMTGVTTSPIPGKLRVAVQDGITFTVYDAGLDAPPSMGVATAEVGGTKGMTGRVSIVAAAKRTSTETVGNPTAAFVADLTAAGNNRIRVVPIAMAAGQTTWVYGGTYWNRGDQGPWRVIREVTPNLIADATNGGNTVFTANASRFLRPGDQVLIDGVTYYVANATPPTDTTFTLASDPAGAVTTPFLGATGVYPMVVTEVALDWRDGEIGAPDNPLIEFDNDIPPPFDGLMLFNNIPFGWKGNEIFPSKIGNPEAFPTKRRRMTQSGADIIHVLAGNARIYVMTTAGLEIVTFTQLESDPYYLRQVWAFGFSSPTQGVVADGIFYGAIGTENGVKIIRTREDDSPDLNFSADVEADMIGWNVENVVMSVDPTNGAVLATHNDGVNSETIPFMIQLGFWSPPQPITGRVYASATVQNNCEFIVFNGTDFLFVRHEAGNGTGDKFAAWPFLDAPAPGFRKTIKRVQVIADADFLDIYTASPAEGFPDLEFELPDTSYALVNQLQAQEIIETNCQQAAAYSIKVRSNNSDAEVAEINVFGIVNRIWR